jgi:DNA-binding FadR family transcriptional regulator
MLHKIIEVHSSLYVARSGGDLKEREGAHRGARAHQRLLALLEQGDAENAERLWLRHLEEGAEYRLDAAGARTVLDLLG